MILKTGLVVTAVAGLVAGLAAQGQPSMPTVDAGNNAVRIVIVSFVAGPVEVEKPDGNGWRPALLNAPVVAGEQIRTLGTGRVEIQFENGSALRLAPNSELAMTTLTRNASGNTVTTANVSGGTAFLTLRKDDAKQFRLQLPRAEAIEADGELALRVDVVAAAAPAITVYGGHPKFSSDNQTTNLARTETAGTPTDQWTSWSRERDQRTQEAFNNGVQPGSLSSYINWYDSAGGSLLNLPSFMDTTLVKRNDVACPWLVAGGTYAGWCWSPLTGWYLTAQAATQFAFGPGGIYGFDSCPGLYGYGVFYGQNLGIESSGFGGCLGGYYGLSPWFEGGGFQGGSGGGTVVTPKVGTSILPPNRRDDHGRGIKFHPVQTAGVNSSRLGIRTLAGEGRFRPVFTSGMGSDSSGRINTNAGTFTSVHTRDGGGSVGGGSIHTSGGGSVGGGSIHTSGGGSVGVGSVKH
jgi:hypothetical protein